MFPCIGLDFSILPCNIYTIWTIIYLDSVFRLKVRRPQKQLIHGLHVYRGITNCNALYIKYEYLGINTKSHHII